MTGTHGTYLFTSNFSHIWSEISRVACFCSRHPKNGLMICPDRQARYPLFLRLPNSNWPSLAPPLQSQIIFEKFHKKRKRRLSAIGVQSLRNAKCVRNKSKQNPKICQWSMESPLFLCFAFIPTFAKAFVRSLVACCKLVTNYLIFSSRNLAVLWFYFRNTKK